MEDRLLRSGLLAAQGDHGGEECVSDRPLASIGVSIGRHEEEAIQTQRPCISGVCRLFASDPFLTKRSMRPIFVTGARAAESERSALRVPLAIDVRLL